MAEEKKDVKPEESQSSSKSEEKKEQSKEVREDVKTPEDVVDKSVYEKVREAMRSEREAKKLERAKVTELEEKIAKIEQSQQSEEEDEGSVYDPYKAKVDILTMMNKDSFVKDNLDLIEEKMTSEKVDISTAVKDLKSEYFDRIQKESTSTDVDNQLKQEKPTATEEEIPPKQATNSRDLIKDALSGKIDMDPKQLEAIKRYFPKK
jgi:hypothetical protein